MPRINLLPWREAERKRKRQEFLLSLGAAVVDRGPDHAARPLADQLVDPAPARPQRPAHARDRGARQADRGDQRPRPAEEPAAGAHGDHRDAAAQPAGDRPRVRRDRPHPARGRLPDVPAADGPAFRDPWHRAVEHARVLVHAQHRRLAVAGRPVAADRRDPQPRQRRAARPSRCSPTSVARPRPRKRQPRRRRARPGRRWPPNEQAQGVVRPAAQPRPQRPGPLAVRRSGSPPSRWCSSRPPRRATTSWSGRSSARCCSRSARRKAS